MAETAIGVVGLLSLFTSAVDCFEYVRIAKSYDRDFATAQLKLDAAAFRLSRWGEAVGLNGRTPLKFPADRAKQGEKILKHLQNVFNKAQESAEIFGTPGAATYDEAELSGSQALVHREIKTKTRKRAGKSRVGVIEKTKWAIYKRKELNGLIDDISALIGQLELILPPGDEPKLTLQKYAQIEAEEIQETVGAQEQQTSITPLQIAETLQEAVEGQDPYLEEAVKTVIDQLRPQLKTSRTTYNVTSRVEGGVKENKGIFSVINYGNSTVYEASAPRS